MMDIRKTSVVIFSTILLIGTVMPGLTGVLAGSTTSFEDGEISKIVDMSPGAPNESARFEVPVESTILTASLAISPGSSLYADSPRVDVGADGSIEWQYKGEGYGLLGHQTEFSDGSESMEFNLWKGNSRNFYVKLPKNAQVESAQLNFSMSSFNTSVSWEFEGFGISWTSDYRANPAFADIDNDGDLDAFLGSSYGYVYFYENTGSATLYNWTDRGYLRNLAGQIIDVGSYSDPAMIDLDNDNDVDLLIGNYDGNFMYFENTGTSNNPTWTSNTTLLGNADVGTVSSPIFVDVNNDNDIDILCGEYYGGILFAENTGTASVPSFDHNAGNWPWISANTGTVDGTFFEYYANPIVGDLDNDNDYDLLVGYYEAGIGYIYHFENTGDPANPAWTDRGNLQALGDNIQASIGLFPALADLDDDGDLDLVYGSYYANLYYYENTGTASNAVFQRPGPVGHIDTGINCAPSLGDLDGDGDLDMIVGNGTGHLQYYRNEGNATDPDFVFDSSVLNKKFEESQAQPFLVDWEGDKDLDLVVGNGTGVIHFFRNQGSTTTPSFVYEQGIFDNQDYGTNIKAFVADLDDDGDQDLAVGENWVSIRYYENTRTNTNPRWTYDGRMFQGLDPGGYRPSPLLCDFDQDGDFDLVIGNSYGDLNYYENTGDTQVPTWSITGLPFYRIDVGGNSVPTFGDLSGDGLPDMIVGNDIGQLEYFIKDLISDPYVAYIDVGEDLALEWNYDGDEAVQEHKIDIKDALNEALSDHSGIDDGYGNRIIEVPISVHIDSASAAFEFCNLDVVYSYTVTTPEFKDSLQNYVAMHALEADEYGNLLVPVKVETINDALINLSGLQVDYDKTPDLVQEIPTVSIPEETRNNTVLDLKDYFSDDITQAGMLSYKIHMSTFNSSIVDVGITNTYLFVDANVSYASQNWTGEGTVQISAADNLGQVRLSNQFKVVIENVNDPPVFTSTPPTNALADTLYLYDAVAKDVDPGDVLVFHLEMSPSGMMVNSATGSITWMPMNSQVGNHGIILVVSDGHINRSQSFLITVAGNPSTNHAPVITSQPGETAFVEQRYSYQVNAYDPDPGTTLTYALKSGPSDMTIDPDTGLILWTGIRTNHLGDHAIIVVASDGIANTTQEFTLTVGQSDNKPPTITSVPVDAASPGGKYIYEVEADDPDPHDKINLRFRLEQGPESMTIDSRTGVVEWTPTMDDLGEHLVVIKVWDLTKAEDTQGFILTVMIFDNTTMIEILSPVEGEKVKGKFKVIGVISSPASSAVKRVDVRIDGGEWKEAVGTSSWYHQFDAGKLSVGNHRVEARAYDGSTYSATTGISFKVEEDASIISGGSASNALMAALAILIIVAAILGLFIGRSIGRKQKVTDELEAEEQKPPEELPPDLQELRQREREFQAKQTVLPVQPIPEEDYDDGGFREAGTGVAEETAYEETVYEEPAPEYGEAAEEPVAEMPPAEEPEQDEFEAEILEEEPALEPEPEPEEPAVEKEETEKSGEKKKDSSLDEILKKLSD
jgi:hypothetical protein